MRPEHGAGCGGDALHIKIAGQQQGGGGVSHLLLEKVLIAEMGQVVGGIGMPQHVLNPSAFFQDAGPAPYFPPFLFPVGRADGTGGGTGGRHPAEDGTQHGKDGNMAAPSRFGMGGRQ